MSKRYARRRPVVVEQVEVADEHRAHLVGKLRGFLIDLLEPWTKYEPQVVEDEETGVERVVHHKIEHPSLLVELTRGAARSTAGASGSGAESRPPASIDPLSLLDEIHRECERLARYVLGAGFVAGVRATSGDPIHRTAVLVRSIAGRGPHLVEEDLAEVVRVVRSWWARARVATAWDVPPVRPHVPCPECEVWGKIRLTYGPPHSATCRECGAAWDSESIDELGTGVATYLEVRRAAALGPDVVAGVVDGAGGLGRGPGRGGRVSPAGAPPGLLAGVDAGRPWPDRQTSLALVDGDDGGGGVRG